MHEHLLICLCSDLLTIQPTRSTLSSAVATLQRPSYPSRLKISDISFYYQAPVLWNSLPHHLRSHSLALSSKTHTPLLSLSSSQFHKQLKTHVFLHSYPSRPSYLSTGLTVTDPLELLVYVIHYSFQSQHSRPFCLLNSLLFVVSHSVSV